MYVNRLYVAQIYVITKRQMESDLRFSIEAEYVKTAMVYHSKKSKYVDLVSGEIYKVDLKDAFVGEMIINLQLGLIPVNENIDVNFERKNMSKRKILKILSNSELLNKKEDDK